MSGGCPGQMQAEDERGLRRVGGRGFGSARCPVTRPTGPWSRWPRRTLCPENDRGNYQGWSLRPAGARVCVVDWITEAENENCEP
jgi:hypothetical protein